MAKAFLADMSVEVGHDNVFGDVGHAHDEANLLDDLAHPKANIPAQRGVGRRGIIASSQP